MLTYFYCVGVAHTGVGRDALLLLAGLLVGPVSYLLLLPLTGAIESADER